MLPQSAQDFMAENQLLVFGSLFGCNIMSGQLINTGAFEMHLNGAPPPVQEGRREATPG